jgi:cytochrome P450
MINAFAHSVTDDWLFGAEMLADPYPFYQRLRETAPVYWSERWQVWVLTRYTDVIHAMRDERLSYHEKMNSFFDQLPPSSQHDLELLNQHISSWLGHQDPPDHTRMRALIGKAFAPRLIHTMRERIERTANDLLADITPTQPFDLMQAFAIPLPAITIAGILGVPPQDYSRFKAWTDRLVAFLGSARPVTEALDETRENLLALRDYVRAALVEHRRHPANDLLSALIDAEEAGGKLTEDEIIGVCSGLFIAGQETTANLIGNGVFALLRQRQQWNYLLENPAALPTAVEELLRYDSPVQRSWGIATTDFDFGAHRIRAGQIVLKMLGAANRDPAQFAEPDSLNLLRQENRHLAFGYGIHFCLGAQLARLEGQIAFEALLRRFPNLRLADAEPPEWHPNMAFRGLKALPVVQEHG